MSIAAVFVWIVGMLLATFLVTLILRPKSGARVAGQIGKSSFTIETEEPK